MRATDSLDAALLALCSELRPLQAEWQRLWSAAYAADTTDTAAQHRFTEFCERIWPGYYADPAHDAAARLLALRAVTVNGIRAKAAALRAIQDAGAYSGHSRTSQSLLVAAFLREVAGRLYMPLGPDAGRPTRRDGRPRRRRNHSQPAS